MSTYRVATGHDVALGSLTVLDPQPQSEGVKPLRRSYTAAGVFDEGGFVELVWSVVVDDAAGLAAILAAFGLTSADSADVTLYARNARFAWVRYNGTAILPANGEDVRWRDFFGRGLTILVRNLEALA